MSLSPEGHPASAGLWLPSAGPGCCGGETRTPGAKPQRENQGLRSELGFCHFRLTAERNPGPGAGRTPGISTLMSMGQGPGVGGGLGRLAPQSDGGGPGSKPQALALQTELRKAGLGAPVSPGKHRMDPRAPGQSWGTPGKPPTRPGEAQPRGAQRSLALCPLPSDANRLAQNSGRS